jgi:hypothetical protein
MIKQKNPEILKSQGSYINACYYYICVSPRLLDIRASSAHFEQIVNDIICVNCLIEFFLMFVSFYKDTNKYVYNQEKLKIFFNYLLRS